MPNPRFITLTGIDNYTFIEPLVELARLWPIEIGILLGNPANGPRYMQPYEIADTLNKIHYYAETTDGLKRKPTVALHLCGFYTRAFVERNLLPIFGSRGNQLIRRVQINGVEANPDFWWVKPCYGVTPIFQHNKQEPIPYTADYHFLQDFSGGQGQVSNCYLPPSIAYRPDLWGNYIVGYAGGLNPENIKQELTKIEQAANGVSYWIDAESGLRDENDIFSIPRAREFISNVVEWKKENDTTRNI